jgi:hypothetical protein
MKRLTVICSVFALVGVLFLTSLALAAGKPKEGWGPRGSYIGRYHVKILRGGGSGVLGGELTMFIQEEFPGSEAPAGILQLKTKTNNDVVYLKEPTHRGSALGATVTGGSFLGPTIGRFVGKMHAPGKIVAGVSTRSLGAMKLMFTRFSTKPTP